MASCYLGHPPQLEADVVLYSSTKTEASMQTSVIRLCFTHIHMHPDVVLLADVGNGDEGVKCSVNCCPSCCTYKERYKTLRQHKGNDVVMQF